MVIFKTLFVTLSKNNNSFTITDETISNNSIFEVYPSDDSVILSDVTVNGTTATIQFDSDAAYNIPCAVFINNLVGAYDTESGIPSPIGQNGKFLTVDNNTTIWKQITTLDVVDLEGTSLNEIVHDVNIELTNTYQETQYNKRDIGLLDNRVTALEESSGGLIYSTTETVIGKWLDGRDVYLRVYIHTGPTSSFSSNTWYSLSDKNGVDLVLSAWLMQYYATGNALYPLIISTTGSDIKYMHTRNVNTEVTTNSKFVLIYVKEA